MDLYDVNGLQVIQHGGSLYVLGQGVMEGDGIGAIFNKKNWKKLVPKARALYEKLAPIGKTLSKPANRAANKMRRAVEDVVEDTKQYIIDNEGEITESMQRTVDNFKEKPKASTSTAGQGIRDSLTPAQRKALDKAMRMSKNK